MAKKIKLTSPPPDSLDLWMAEIAMAFKGAEQFMQAPLLAAAEAGHLETWHVAPMMALGARGLLDNERLLDTAAGYAFENFEANYGLDGHQAPPAAAFAFVYVGAHLGLDLIDEAQADEIMDLIEANPDTLAMMIERAAEMLKANNPFAFMTGGGAAPGAPPAPKPRRKSKTAGQEKGRETTAPAGPEAAGPAGRIYVLEISLLDIKPRIWRRVALPADFSLALLHNIIQILFGWEDYHLHEFRVGDTRYSPSQEHDDDLDDRALPEKRARLREVAPAQGAKFLYVYDFGDDWRHQIKLKSIDPPRPGVSYPVCEAGARCAPPEDCGGPWGYEDILNNLALPKNKRDEERMEWLGEDFDPDAFDRETINAKLKRVGGVKK